MSSVFVRHLAAEAGAARMLRAHLAELDSELPIALAPPADIAIGGRHDVAIFLVTAAALADPAFTNDMNAAADRGTLLAVRLDGTPLPPRLHAFSMRSPEPATTNAAVAARLADWLDRPGLRAAHAPRGCAPRSSAAVPAETGEPASPPRPRTRPRSATAAETGPTTAPEPFSIKAPAPRIRRTHGWRLVAGVTALALVLVVPPALAELSPQPLNMLRAWTILIAAFVLYPFLGGLGAYVGWSLVDPATASRPVLRTIGAAILAAGIACSIAAVAALLALFASGWLAALFGIMALALLTVIPASALAAGLATVATRRKLRIGPAAPAYVAIAAAAVLMLVSGRPILRIASDNRLIADVVAELDRVGYHVVHAPDLAQRKLDDARRDASGEVVIALPKDGTFDSLRGRIVEFESAAGLRPAGTVTAALLDRLRALPAKTLWRLSTGGAGDAIAFTEMVERAGPGSIIEVSPGIHRVQCPYMPVPVRLILRGTGHGGDSVIVCDEAFTFMIDGGGRVENLVIRAGGSAGSLDLAGSDERAIVVRDVRLDGVTLNATAPNVELTNLVAQDLVVSDGTTTLTAGRFTAPQSRSAIKVTLTGRIEVERTSFAALGKASAIMVEASDKTDEDVPPSRFVDNEVDGITDPAVPAIYVRSGAPEVRRNRLADVAGPCILIGKDGGGVYRDNRLDRCGRRGGPSIAIAAGATPTVDGNQFLHPGGVAILRASPDAEADVK